MDKKLNLTKVPEKYAGKMVVTQGINKWFEDLHVLIDMDLVVANGDVVVLIGPSGAGKSTLLRCISRLEKIESGYIYVDGILISGINEKGKAFHAPRSEMESLRGEVGMVFQQFNLFPHITALRNVTEALMTVKKMKKKDAEEIAIAQLRRVGLTDKTSSYPAKLSGGQQQRLAIARALAMQPKVMLFDEVTSALDPELIGEVLLVMRNLASEGMTMIVVSHEMDFTRDVADRVIVMVDGKILEEGSPSQIFSDPRYDRTRQFLQSVRTR